jgi:phosphomannomutase
VDRAKLKPLTIVSNPGNGGAGLVIDLIENDLPFQFIKVHHEPDGTFPHGVPNPMLEENRAATPTRCAARTPPRHRLRRRLRPLLLLRRARRFIEGYYIVGLLASVFLRRFPGGRIVHDPRLTWNTLEIVKAPAARRCCASPATPSSSSACARWTRSTAAR